MKKKLLEALKNWRLKPLREALKKLDKLPDGMFGTETGSMEDLPKVSKNETSK